MEVNELKLENGLNTLTVNSPGSTAASVQVWFRAGSALESEEEQGIAHFLEHMFFKGTPTRPGSALAFEVESFGAEINAFTSFDYTCYYINCPNSYLEKSIEILMDMVSNPLFTQEELIPERDVVFEEYLRSVDNPNQYAFSQIQSNFFPKGYRHSILGNEKTIKSFTREQLTSFRNRYYHLENALLLVSGDLKRIDLTSIKHSLPENGQKSNYPLFKLRKNRPIEIHHKDVNMGQLSIAITAPEYESNNAPTEDLLLNCLGHGETSRLYRKLVQDSAIASKASASTLYLTKGGTHFIRINFPQKNLSKVLTALTSIFKEIRDNGFEPWEIQKIKNQYIASKIYERETIESYALALGHGFAQTGNIYCEDEFITQMKKVTKGQINAAISNVFGREISLSLQLPEGQSTAPAKKSLESFQAKLTKLFDTEVKKGRYKTITSKYDPQARVIELKKGVQLLYRQNLMTPTFVLHTYIRGGLTEEKKVNNGTYHLLSSMLDKGYDKFSEEDINKIVDDCSASLNNFSGKNAYGLTLHGQSEHIFTLFPHFSGSLLRPKMNQKYLTHEKEMSYRALDNHEKDPLKKCFSQFDRLIFNAHPYSMNLIGTKTSLKKIKRSELIELHQKNLKKKSILFTYCGDMELDEVIDLLKPTVDQLPVRTEKKFEAKKITPLNGEKAHIEFEREQTQIFIGTSTPKLSAHDNQFYKMLSTHLSGQSSPLFTEVRDRQGLCYAAQPLLFSALEGGYWGIYMGSGNDKVEAAIKAILKIIDEIKTNGLTEPEFKRIKKMIEGQNLLTIQTNEDYANVYSIPVLQNLGLDYFYKNNDFIKELTYQEFQQKIKKLLSRKWTQVTVGTSN